MKNNHLMYSPTAEKVILKYIDENYPEPEREEMFKKFNKIYLSFLEDLPNIGGKKNTQSVGVYDSISLFALYEATGRKISLQKMEKLNEEVFVPAYERMKFINVNHTFLLRLMNMVFMKVSNDAKKHEKEWVGNYHMEVEPFDKNLGIRYKFYSCPIAEFAKAHGYTDIMSAFCNGDYPMLKLMHAGFIRRKTCALDEYCDYWILGDKSGLLKEHEEYRDEFGFVRNR